jgi:predicted ATP-dependent endonuclease of OLD family
VHKEVTGFDRLLQVVLHQMWIIQRKNDDWLGRFSEKINAEMEEWGVKIELEQQKKNHPEFSAQVFVQNGAASDALQKGKGMERALTFAVFEAVDEFFSHQRSKQNILVLFEEPELFLHPQAQNELFLSLKTLAKSGMQILLTTHSSYFLDLTYHRSICIVRKDSLVQGTKVQQVLSDIFYSESDKKNFNMGYWINPDRGELFFAKKVILAEGPTEKVVLPKLAKKLGISRYEYTVIDCAGKSNMPLYITLLNAFEIPYVAVYDLDYHKHRSKKALLAASRHSGFIDGKIDPAIGESVVFENDIEQELEFRKSRKKHKPFSALQFIDDPHFRIPKKLEGKLRKIFE